MSSRKNHLLRLFLLVTAAFALPGLSYSQTADEIIAKSVQARGGLDKLKAIQTMRTTGTIIVMGSIHIKYVVENKRDDRIRQNATLQGMTQVQAYDGKTAWQINPFQGRRDPELISADEAKSLVEDADIDGALVDFKSKGSKVEYIGHDSVEGTDCYKLRLTYKNGDVRYYYLDTDSLLDLKTEDQRSIRGTVQYSETTFGDYEQVDGVFFPFASQTKEKGGSGNSASVTVSKVEINPPLDDKLFVLPVVKAPKEVTGQ